ncbi:hypothetical protein FRC05_007629 [Tulasnella sp. 425]|nr:hypothetical protein FRC05_007629 [Tulasnella sp. 425]
MKDLWKRLDEDQDGFITKADVLRFFNNLGFGKVDDEGPLDALFEKYDTDHDGKLNFDDHDGKITFEELLQFQKEKKPGEYVLSDEKAREWFDDWDIDGDGVINAKDYWNGVLL